MTLVTTCENHLAFLLQPAKGERVFGLSPSFLFTTKWGRACRPRNAACTDSNSLVHHNSPAAVDTVGTYAEYATVKCDLLATIPDNVSFDQAAALPLVSLTAMQASHNPALRGQFSKVFPEMYIV